MTNQTIINLLSDRLKLINFVNNKSVSNDFLSKLGYHAPNLEGIDLSGTLIEDSALVELYTSLDQIRTLKICSCPNLTEDSIGSIIESHRKTLEYVTLGHNRWAITDAAIKNLHRCNLIELDLSYCTELTTEALTNFATKSTGSRLEVLRLDGQKSQWTSEALALLITKNAKTLRVVSLANFSLTKFSSLFCKALGTCTKLEQLYLNKFQSLTDEGYNQINGYYDNMQVLSLSMLDSLSDYAIPRLPQKCANLKCLNLTGCLNLTEEKLFSIVKNVSGLRTVICNLCP